MLVEIIDLDLARLEALVWLVALSDPRNRQALLPRLEAWLDSSAENRTAYWHVLQARRELVAYMVGQEVPGSDWAFNYLSETLTLLAAVLSKRKEATNMDDVAKRSESSETNPGGHSIEVIRVVKRKGVRDVSTRHRWPAPTSKTRH